MDNKDHNNYDFWSFMTDVRFYVVLFVVVLAILYKTGILVPS
jgi:hypothetical protein